MGAIVHVASVTTGGTANTVTSSAIDTTGANLIVVVASYFSSSVTLTDSNSNSWTGLTAVSSKIRIFYCASPTVGSGHTFTLTGTGTYPTVSVNSFSGAHTSPFDQETGNTGATPGAITPSVDDCVLVTGATSASSSSSLAGGWTTQSTAYLASNHMAGASSYLIQTTAASVNPSWTNAGPTAMAAFKPAAGGGSVPVIFRNWLNHSSLKPKPERVVRAAYLQPFAAQLLSGSLSLSP